MAGGGADIAYGGDGDDNISGGDEVGAGDIWLGGDAGNDIVTGGAGNDRIDGGDGDDIWLAGEAGIDAITGGAGNDRIDGGAGDDYLYGESGSDAISGGSEDDYINGGTGTDYLIGNGGFDRFDFDLGSGVDIISDFTNDEDTLQIDPAYGFASAAAVLLAISASGTDALLDLGGGNSVRLVGYLAGNAIGSLLDDVLVA